MDCYRKMLTITDPIPSEFEIPTGLEPTYRGRIPRSVVLYTGAGILLSRLQEQRIQERTSFVVNSNTVGSLLRLQTIEPIDHLEFESHSNTEVIVRAYDSHGQEKNTNRDRNTHKKVHCMIQVHSGFQNSLDISSAFPPPLTNLGPNLIGLMTGLGHHWVTAASTPPDGRYRLYGRRWERFHRMHLLEEGMILVFKKDSHDLNFEVYFYNSDGSEAAVITRRPAGFGTAGMSFYKYPHEINMEGTELRLARRFVELNWNLLTHRTRVVTEDGYFYMKYDRTAQNNYAITGNWDTIFQNFSAEDNTGYKFFLSLNNDRPLRSGCCTMFVVAFGGDDHLLPELSIEVSDDPLLSSDEDSSCTNLDLV